MEEKAPPPMVASLPLRRTESAPSLTADQGLGSTGMLIPSYYRSHRAISALCSEKGKAFSDRLLEQRDPEECHDNVAQWYPLEQRPKWVTMRAFQRRQMRPWAERGKLPGGGGLGRTSGGPGWGRPASSGASGLAGAISITKSQGQVSYDKIFKQVSMPPAGSRVASGGFPNSFDFSAGKTSADCYYTHAPSRSRAFALKGA